MNLTAANLNADLLGLGSSPVWQELYSARALYGLTDLSPKQLDAFVHRMVSDRDLFMRYFRYQPGNYSFIHDYYTKRVTQRIIKTSKATLSNS